MSGGKLWGFFLTKDVILANSDNWANFFLQFSLKFLFSLSKLLHSRRSEKNTVEKALFFEKTHFFQSFPPVYRNFQDLPPTFFIRVVKRFFSMSRRTLPRKLGFLLKKFYLTLFPESAWTTIGFSTIFFQWGRQSCGHCVQNSFPRENFLKKKFLKVFYSTLRETLWDCWWKFLQQGSQSCILAVQTEL